TASSCWAAGRRQWSEARSCLPRSPRVECGHSGLRHRGRHYRGPSFVQYLREHVAAAEDEERIRRWLNAGDLHRVAVAPEPDPFDVDGAGEALEQAGDLRDGDRRAKATTTAFARGVEKGAQPPDRTLLGCLGVGAFADKYVGIDLDPDQGGRFELDDCAQALA